MTFLYPNILWGLFAVLIPLIIHLINLRKPKTLLFSNIEFVKEVQKAVKKRVRLKDYILLALRTLAIAFLVLAFAGPVLKKEETSTGNKHSVVILLDNSYSMMMGDAYGAYFQQAKNIAENLLQQYPNTDEFLVLPFSEISGYKKFLSKKQALKKIPALKTDIQTISLPEIFSKTEKIFAKAQNPNKHLYILSDFQKNTVFLDSTTKPLENFKIKLIKIGEENRPNAYVSQLEYLNRSMDNTTPLSWKVNVKNSGNSDIKSMALRVSVNGQIKERATLNIPPGQIAEKKLHYSDKSFGWKKGKIEIDDPNLVFDNTFYFTYEIKEKVRTAVFSKKQPPTGLKTLLAEVLKSEMETSFLPIEQFNVETLGKYSVIILNGIPEWGDAMFIHLKKWLQEGNGLIIIPRTEKDKDKLNTFFSAFQLGSVGKLKEFSQGTELRKPPLESPFYKGVFRETQGEFLSPEIKKIFVVKPNPQIPYEVLVQTYENFPFALHYPQKAGHIFILASSLESSWNSLQKNDFFIPFFHRMLILSSRPVPSFFYLKGGKNSPSFSVKTEEKLPVRLKLSADSTEIIPEQYQEGNFRKILLKNISLQPGIYEVLQGNKLLRFLAVNSAPEESEMQFATLEELEKAFPQVEVLQESPQTVASYVQTEVLGVSLARLFLLLVLLLLLAEMLVVKFV